MFIRKTDVADVRILGVRYFGVRLRNEGRRWGLMRGVGGRRLSWLRNWRGLLRCLLRRLMWLLPVVPSWLNLHLSP